MLEFASGFLARAAVMVPTCLMVGAGAWLALKKAGAMRLHKPFNVSDLRTWPLAYAVGDTAIFAIVFSAVSAGLGNSTWAAAIAGGASAMVALGIAPLLLK